MKRNWLQPFLLLQSNNFGFSVAIDLWNNILFIFVLPVTTVSCWFSFVWKNNCEWWRLPIGEPSSPRVLQGFLMLDTVSKVLGQCCYRTFSTYWWWYSLLHWTFMQSGSVSQLSVVCSSCTSNKKSFPFCKLNFFNDCENNHNCTHKWPKNFCVCCCIW